MKNPIKQMGLMLTAALVFAPAAFAQMPKVAVYVSEHSGYSQEEKSALRTATLNTLVRSGQYEVIERSDILDAELEKQASGAVDEGQLVAFGRQMGAEYVCVSDITSPFGGQNYQVSVRMIDIETAEVAALSVTEANIASGYTLSSAVVEAVMQMLNSMSYSKTASNMRKTTVYVEGGADQRVRGALYTYMLNALFTQSKGGVNFKVVERSEAFTSQIDKEQITQRGGAVDENQIARLGKQYGIENICVANIEYTSNIYIISTRVINVETASMGNISQMYYVASDSISLNKLRTISTSMVNEVPVFGPAKFTQMPKAVVYVSERSQVDRVLLKSAAVNKLARSGKFQVIDRSNIIDAELIKQASGAVDDDQIVAFGRQSGARYVCVPEMLSPFGTRYVSSQNGSYSYTEYQVSTRLIDVETAEVVALGVKTLALSSPNGRSFSNAVDSSVHEMLQTLSQNKTNPDVPKMAVYVQGQRATQGVGNAFYTYVLNALFTRSIYNGDFKVVERSEAFTRQLDREQGTQRSGAVDDAQISRMGKQYGVERILIASIDYAMNTYNISARLVNVETAKVEKASRLYSHPTESSMEEYRILSVRMVEDMITRKKSQSELEAERTHVRGAPTIGGGVSLMMNSVDTLYKYNGGQFHIGFELFKNNIDFVHLGACWNFGGMGVNNKERIIADFDSSYSRSISSYFQNLNAFVKLYPMDRLYLSGGVGISWRNSTVKLKDENGRKDRIPLISVTEPVYSIGAGVVVIHAGTHNSRGVDDMGGGYILDAQYNMVPVKDKLAGYLSINLTIGGCRRGIMSLVTPKEI